MNNFDRMSTIKRDTETKNLRRIILKYLKDIPIVNEQLRGVFSITGYRVYEYEWSMVIDYVEIDVVFKGEINAQISSIRGNEWFGSDIKENKSYQVSPRKLGRFLRNSLLRDINQKLVVFSTEIHFDCAIKKIKWE